MPSARASHKLRRRTLAVRLTALTERHIRELEESGCVDPEKLGEALELYKMAKVAAMGRRRRRNGSLSLQAADGGPMRPINELCAVDVDLHRAPKDALDDFLEHRDRPPEEMMPRRRGRSGSRFTSEVYHRWMMERE